MADILDQVTSRRLPSLFDYHLVPSPWFTVSLCKLITLLAAADSEYAVYSVNTFFSILQETLQDYVLSV